MHHLIMSSISKLIDEVVYLLWVVGVKCQLIISCMLEIFVDGVLLLLFCLFDAMWYVKR
jgi:hypothetical protein